MNSRERVLKSMAFAKPDRIPHYNSFMPGFVKNWRKFKGLDNSVQASDYYDIDVNIVCADETFFPSEKQIIKDEGNFVIARDGWGRTVRKGKGNSYFTEFIETTLNDPSALDKLSFEAPSDDMRYGEPVRTAREAMQKGRCVFAKTGGIYIRSHFLRGEDMLLMDMATDEKFCDELFDKVAEHLTAIALETLRRTDTYDTGLWVFDDMASSRAPMFSPAMFERYLLPRYKKMIDTVKGAGCKYVILHSDGNLLPVLDLALDAGFDGFNPVEPRCGMDVVRLRNKYSGRAVFFGGVCNTVILPKGNREEIRKHVEPILAAAREGGIIPGFASAESDISPASYDYYHSLVMLCRV